MKKMWSHTRMRRFIVIPAAFLLILLLAGSAYAAYMFTKVNHTLQQISEPPAADSSASAPLAEPVPVSRTNVQEQADQPLTFLLTAIDERAGSEGSLNTDVMMLVSVNKTTRQATIVSIPRDLEVPGEQSGLEASHKANYFYAYFYNKNKSTAMERTKELYSSMYQVPIDYMAVINFEGFRKLIDQLGGLRVNVDMDMKYTDDSDGTRIDLRKGEQLLSGSQALDFLRYRKSNGGTEESSDIARNEREQLVLNQVMDKLTSLHGITAWSHMLDIVGDNVKTDIPFDMLKQLTGSYQKLKPETIRFIHLDGEWKSPYLVVDKLDLEQALQALRDQSGISIDSSPRTD